MKKDEFINPSDQFKKVKMRPLPKPSPIQPSLEEEWEKEGIDVGKVPVTWVNAADGPKEEGKEKATKFIELVGGGMKPAKAAKELGTTVGAIMSRSQMQEAITSILELGGLKADVKREVLRAGLFKMFVEGTASMDPKLRKLAIEAAKQIGGDPEIGLGQTEHSISIDLGGLGTAIQNLELPGIKNPYIHDLKANADGKEDDDGGQENSV